MTQPGAALVTGASSGIGAATCERLREQGWHVTGLARRPSPEADVSLQVDITDHGQVAAAVGAVPDLRLLVHSAAVIGPIAPFESSEPDDWRLAVEINLLGTYNVLRAALSGPIGRNGGIVIHLTTGAAANPNPYWSAYSTSKAGAEMLMRSAASEVDGSVCGICSLSPGITETAMQRELRASDFPDHERFVRAYEDRTSRTPREVADAVAELSRREPGTLNGRTFRVGAL